MAPLPKCPSPLEVEFHFRSLLAREEFAQPDQIRYELEDSLLVFGWREPKLAVEVELEPAGPVDVRKAPVPT